MSTVGDILLPGDVLLYGAKGFYGKIIAIKTWHGIGHVEVFIGGGFSVASRDGQGVGRYDARLLDIKHVLRPTVPFDLTKALAWFFTDANGQPYGWWDLLHFIGIAKDGQGMVCSPFATEFLRAGGVPIFNNEPAIKVAPFMFLLSEFLKEVPIDNAEVAAIPD